MYIIFVLVYYLFLTSSVLKEKEKIIEAGESASMATPKEKLTRISVKKRQEIYSIPVSQILYIEANGDYVLIYTLESKYLKDRTMKYWETYLPDDLFVRIHRSFIVNIEYISKIELFEKETYKIQLKTGVGLKASTAGYKLLKQKMQL
jgi:DNA-binding LytR/AlgR family response regulator